MNKTTYWKNFNLGRELEIAGSFIYNGLKAFDNMESFCYDGEIFEFLYNISVGIERLEKVTIILIEHDDKTIQEEFEKSLITHNHMELMHRILLKFKLDIHNSHNAFIQLLSEFYKTYRYDRYILREAYSYDKERVALVAYLERYLNLKIEYKEMFSITKNNNKIKKFIGKIIGKICAGLYEIVSARASAQNIYTYEIRTDSKAYKIFMRKEYDFTNENIVWKEILLFFMHIEGHKMIELMKEIEPLDFDVASASDYIQCFKSDLNKTNYIDEVDALYDEIEGKQERFELLELLDKRNILWDYEEEEEDELALDGRSLEDKFFK